MANGPGTYDVVVVGAGPAGSASAWAAARLGARVLCLEKKKFPRDKPCGDGITPRAVKLMCEMGLESELSQCQPSTGIRVVGRRHQWERDWPARPGFPTRGYVVRRTILDEMLVRRAQAEGAVLVEDARALGAVVERGKVCGIRMRLNSGKEQVVSAEVVIGADGMSSRIARSLNMRSIASRPFGITARAQVAIDRPLDSVLEIYPEVVQDGQVLPGYGWVFPMGEGIVNLGVGFVNTRKDWRNVKIGSLMDSFIAQLPEQWHVPSAAELTNSGRLNGWKLPMGFAVWPAWRPGAMLVGDAAGVAKPFTGAGISRALQSGMRAGEIAVDALGAGTPDDLSQYGDDLGELWSNYYRMGRLFAKAMGHPRGMTTFVGTGMLIPSVMMRTFGFKRTR